MASETTSTVLETAVDAAHGAASNGAHKAFPPLDPSTFSSQLIWLAITLGGLYFVLSRIALPRIGEVIEERRDRIRRDLDEAERLKNETEEAIASYEQALAEARGKAHGIAQKSRDKITAEVDAEAVKADELLASASADAEARISASKAKAMKSVKDVARDTAQAIVSRLIGTDVSTDEAAKAVASSQN
jgi:F-type H+-transporting ATPase subunit b